MRSHLDRVLAGPEFKNAGRMRAFLRFVVEETLGGRGEELKAYTIGLAVYGKGPGFDPTTDPIVRVDAGRLRRKLQAHYADVGASEPMRIELPKGRYAPRFRIAGSGAGSPGPAACGLEVPTILVMPFENLGDDPEQAFFCEGLTDEIINELTRFPGVRVLGRQTSFRLAAERRDVSSMSAEVGARFVLTGTVRRGQDRFRVNSQLIDGADRRQIWSESYTRELTAKDLIEIQDDITRHVAAGVAEPYGVIPRLFTEEAHQRTSESLTAYEWVLRFYRYWAEPLPDRYEALRDNLPGAIQMDPTNASIHAAYSMVCSDAVRFVADPSRDRAAWFDAALGAARRAVELDSTSAFSYQAFATVLFHTGDLAGYGSAVDRALTLCPNHANLLADMAVFKACLGAWDEAGAMTDRAIDLNPHHPAWYHIIPCLRALFEGDFERAVREAKLQITPGLALTRVNAAMAFDAAGMTDNAARELQLAQDELPIALGAFVRDSTALWNMQPELADRYNVFVEARA